MEKAKRSRSRAEILAEGERCIYCLEPAVTVEHMPPRDMFRGKQRPHGMEFACCEACNNGTSAADLVASFMSRISHKADAPDWKAIEAQARQSALARKAPGFMEELFDGRRVTRRWVPYPNGLLMDRAVVKASGPLARAYLDTFAAKFGMALYREHCGAPLPANGGVLSAAFLNAGLSQDTANVMLSIMPSGATLRQGIRNSAHDQFFYRFNTDDHSVVAALAAFHDGIHVCTIGFADAERYSTLALPPFFRLARPGSLLGMMPFQARSWGEQQAVMAQARG